MDGNFYFVIDCSRRKLVSSLIAHGYPQFMFRPSLGRAGDILTSGCPGYERAGVKLASIAVNTMPDVVGDRLVTKDDLLNCVKRSEVRRLGFGNQDAPACRQDAQT